MYDLDVLAVSVALQGEGTVTLSPVTQQALRDRMDRAEIRVVELDREPTALTIERERLSFRFSRNEATVDKAYPKPSDLERVAQGVEAFTSTIISDFAVSSIRYGMACTLAIDSQAASVLRKLFADELPLPSWTVNGGWGTLVYSDGESREWQFVFEPRATDEMKIFLGAALQVTSPSLIVADMTERLEEMWEVSRRFLHECVE